MERIGNRIIELKEIDSTNAYAGRLLQSGDVEEGTVVWAFSQTAGKGQGENKWESEPGKNLTFSLVLHPSFLRAEQQFYLNKVISLGVVDFFRDFTEEVSIKWPNDIYLGDKKAGGILLQHRIIGDLMETTIAGIGINVNQVNFNPGLPDAVSLTGILGLELDLRESLLRLLYSLELRYGQLIKRNLHFLDQEYHRSLYGFGSLRMFRKGNERIEGIIRGVDESGRLLIWHPGREQKAYTHREILFT